MKKVKKQKHAQAVDRGKKSEFAQSRKSTALTAKHEAPGDRAARQEERKQEKAECAVQCKKYIKQLQERLLQPSRKHYGGLGYAKESIFVQLDDPDYLERFQQIWDEHIPGFSGKSFKKRKSDTAENMLWRQRLRAKHDGEDAPAVEELLSSAVHRHVSKAARPKQAQATSAAEGSQKKPLSQHTERTSVASIEPDLQAQVMAAYRNMKFKQRETAKKASRGHKNR